MSLTLQRLEDGSRIYTHPGRWSGLPRSLRQPLVEAHLLFDHLLDRARRGSPPLPLIDEICRTVTNGLAKHGISPWVEATREINESTVQHCMLVLGLTIATAQHLRFGAGDIARLAAAAALHDIGKAQVPRPILYKPHALTPDEFTCLQSHPLLAYRAIALAGPVDPLVGAVVMQHHERLDGTGYPGRLGARQIGDPVRLFTIADMFGALIERRSYRPPFPAQWAFEMLRETGGAIDQTFVKAFRPLAEACATADEPDLSFTPSAA
jgi:HD-GYP domain-containing protein (c-di-GMP phosphodiesterase class II)